MTEKSTASDQGATQPQTEAAAEAQLPVSTDKAQRANSLVLKHVLASVGVGVVPLPLLDFVGNTGIQLNLLYRLSKLYDIPYSHDMVKNIIAPLLAGAAPAAVARPVYSALRVIPIAGPILGALTMPSLSGAATYALGKVFIQHFESGGTFLNFDPEAVKDYFAQQFQEGKLVVKQHTTGAAA